MVENEYMYQICITPTIGLNFLTKFCVDDIFIIEIKFREKSLFHISNQNSLDKIRWKVQWRETKSHLMDPIYKNLRAQKKVKQSTFSFHFLERKIVKLNSMSISNTFLYILPLHPKLRPYIFLNVFRSAHSFQHTKIHDYEIN